MFWDLLPLSDEIYGWDTNYRQLRKVGLEAVIAHPRKYFGGVIRSFGEILLLNYRQPVSLRCTQRICQQADPPRDDRGLPIPSKGDIIPRNYYWFGGSSPDLKLRPDPDSVDLRILDPTMQKRVDDLSRELCRLQDRFPDRNGSVYIANILNDISTIYPPALAWLMVGILGFICKPDSKKGLLLFLCSVCIGILFYTTLGLPAILVTRTPFDPVIMLTGVVGIIDIWLTLKGNPQTG